MPWSYDILLVGPAAVWKAIGMAVQVLIDCKMAKYEQMPSTEYRLPKAARTLSRC